MSFFLELNPTLDNYWRSIILFGRNSATFKFALAKSLLEFAEKGITEITLNELAIPYSKYIKEHLQLVDKQGTSPNSSFINACRDHNKDTISDDNLIKKTVSHGFENVIDAFHNVNQGELPVRFYVDERKTNNRIILTDELLSLKENFQFENLFSETEARWRLVETAWSLNISSRLLEIKHDSSNQILYIESREHKRINVTSARDALNGYQKGKCFYCFADISLETNNLCEADVDHFFPFTLIQLVNSPEQLAINGIWNLVLACQNCNRGESGKFAKVPELRYLERLHTRNDFFITSHHPLRETLINQTGSTEPLRRSFLQSNYNLAKSLLIHSWKPKEEHPQAF